MYINDVSSLGELSKAISSKEYDILTSEVISHIIGNAPIMVDEDVYRFIEESDFFSEILGLIMSEKRGREALNTEYTNSFFKAIDYLKNEKIIKSKIINTSKNDS